MENIEKIVNGFFEGKKIEFIPKYRIRQELHSPINDVLQKNSVDSSKKIIRALIDLVIVPKGYAPTPDSYYAYSKKS